MSEARDSFTAMNDEQPESMPYPDDGGEPILYGDSVDSDGDEVTELDPGVVCIVHIEKVPGGTEPAVIAHLLGNDPELIRTAIADDREQEQSWTEAALEEQQSAQPDLELAEVNLGEARTWAVSAQLKTDALAYVLAEEPPLVDFAYDRNLEEIQRSELAWLEVHRQCDEHWNETGDCPTHGEAITAGRARQERATITLLREIREHLANE